MNAAELIDRTAEKLARTKGVASVVSNEDRMEVHLENGQTVTFTVTRGGK